MKILFSIAAASLLAALAGAQAAELGHVDFPSSGAKEAQEPFLKGVLLLHSFEYEDAREEFQRAREIDPGFALAAWGEALTHSHPIWREEDVPAARAALERLAPTPEERAAKAPTAREKSFLGSVELLFGEGDRLARHRAYSEALGELWESSPDDLEAGAFYALSILGTSLGVRDERIYMRAAAVGEEVYGRAPRHPGALHYLIHCYDDPVHAPLGLRMARAYDKVAPAAAHALHMPSHIYVALGMWEESAAANVSSAAAADARRARKGLDLDSRGWHSIWWLHYTRLQEGRIRDAQALLAEAERDAKAAGSERTRYHLAVMRAAHVLETKDWDGPAARIEVDLAELSTATIAADHCVRGFAALHRGEVAAAKEILAAMRSASPPMDAAAPYSGGSLASCCAPSAAVNAIVTAPGRAAADVMAKELEGAIALAKHDAEAGLALLRAAAELEDKMDYDFGPPLVIPPAHELLGEELLLRGDAEGAAREFEKALARAPRRAASLRGLAAAAKANGDETLAAETLAELDDVWREADADYVKSRRLVEAPAPSRSER